MCVPCAAAAPELLPILLFILFVIGLIVLTLCRALPYVGMALVAVVAAVYRFVTGAVLGKPLGRSDDEHWAASPRGPRVTRPVKAVARLALVGALVGYFLNPWAVVIACGTLSVAASGLTIYGRRSQIRAAITRAPAPELNAPIRVKARIGRG